MTLNPNIAEALIGAALLASLLLPDAGVAALARAKDDALPTS